MQSLMLRDGDLVTGAGGFALIEGREKVRQDLGLAVREPFGSDRFHPRWGSVLRRYIGNVQGAELEMLVTSEVSRLVQNYAVVQQEQVTRDAAMGRKPRFSTGELISGVERIEVRQAFDRYRVAVTLRTVAGEVVSVGATVR